MNARVTDWDRFYFQYLQAADKHETAFRQHAGDTEALKQVNLEFEAVFLEMIRDIREPLSQENQEDLLWLTHALEDPKKKWFVAAVFRRLEPIPKKLFRPLIRAGVYEVNPSANREFIEPCNVAFGALQVMRELLNYLETGTDHEKAGSVNALYWVRYDPEWNPTLDESEVEAYFEELKQLAEHKRGLCLKTFVDNENTDVRRSIIMSLELKDPSVYPVELQPLVGEAVRIAQDHPDEFIRHRVKLQLGETNTAFPLPHRQAEESVIDYPDRDEDEETFTLPLTWIGVVTFLIALAFLNPWCK